MNENLRNNVYYDALGRKTQAEPSTRRYLFEKNKSLVKETELGMEGLMRDSPSGLCCVEEGSFRVQLRDEDDPIATDISGDNKFGVKVKFNAEFARGNGCDPKCCEFRQEVKAKIFKNGVYDTGGNCGDLDSNIYIPDCYGRGYCNSSDKEEYNDLWGTYSGKDFPGLRVEEGDSIDVKMEFNSYIVDICPNPYYVKETKYWGFHIQGIVPEPYNSLNATLMGEINQ